MTPGVTHSEAHDETRFLDAVRERLAPIDSWGSFRRGARSAAVALILYRREEEWRVPFVLRRDDLRSHPGQVGLPGGSVVPGEGAWDGAAREVEEEIGVMREALHPLGAGPATYTSVSNFSVVPFVAWLAAPPERFVHDPGELQSVLEVPLRRLLDRSAWAWDERPGGPHLPVGDDISIWGLTGGLLADLLPLIAAAQRAP